MVNDTMLKKYYPKEIEIKEANNELAKDYSTRTEEKIEYNKNYPLEINEDLKVIELGIHKDLYDEDFLESRGYGLKTIRILFEEKEKSTLKEMELEENENNQYFIDIMTTLSLDELEEQLSRCETEDEIMNLSE